MLLSKLRENRPHVMYIWGDDDHEAAWPQRPRRHFNYLSRLGDVLDDVVDHDRIGRIAAAVNFLNYRYAGTDTKVGKPAPAVAPDRLRDRRATGNRSRHARSRSRVPVDRT